MDGSADVVNGGRAIESDDVLLGASPDGDRP